MSPGASTATRARSFRPRRRRWPTRACCIAPGPVALRAYRPLGAKADEQLPALVYFHGGGWVIGDLDTHDVLCRQLANGARCTVYSVDYRLAPEHPFPAAVDDCLAAVKFVAGRHKLVAVGGDSAGGNLATVVALHSRDHGGPQIAYQLLIYPATDQRALHPSIQRNGEGYLLTKKSMDYFQAQYLPRKADLLDWRASPLLAKTLAGLPPAYLITAGYDPLLDEGREYAERMAKEGVEVAYREYSDMVHGFILFGGVLDTANARGVRVLREAARLLEDGGHMPSRNDLIWQVLFPFFIALVLVFASIGFVVGMGLIFSSARTLRFFRVMNRWISTRGAFRATDIPRSTEQFSHRNRRWVGWALIAGGIFSTVGLAVGVDAAAVGATFAKGAMVPLVVIVAGTLRWFLIVGSVAGVVVGGMLCFSPDALATLEKYANRWFTGRRMLRGGDDMILTLDRLVEAHPRLSGAILACTTLGAAAYAATLLFARL